MHAILEDPSSVNVRAVSSADNINAHVIILTFSKRQVMWTNEDAKMLTDLVRV